MNHKIRIAGAVDATGKMSQIAVQLGVRIGKRDAIIETRYNTYNNTITVLDSYYLDNENTKVDDDDMPEDETLTELARKELE